MPWRAEYGANPTNGPDPLALRITALPTVHLRLWLHWDPHLLLDQSSGSAATSDRLQPRYHADRDLSRGRVDG